jgi:Tol biopolymer transport system component
MTISPRSSASALLTLFVAGVVGCGSDSSTGPHSRGLSVIAGGGQSDTVLSVLPQSLIVQLLEPSGDGGHVVQFASVAVPSESFLDYAYVKRLDMQSGSTFAVDTTTSNGRAEIQVVLGQIAGPAPIVVSVPDFGIVDTITFTATPGRAVGISVAPKDTTLAVNGTATLRGGAVDQYGNVRSDPVVFSALSGSATVSGATVTGTGIGPASILVTSNGLSDTAFVGVVPAGVLAAGSSAGLRIFNLDGSGMHVVSVATGIGNVRWAPSGASLAYDQTFEGQDDGGSTLYTITPSGTISSVDVSPGFRDQWPQWSRDGSTIYYSKIGGAGSSMWHVTPGGTSDDSVPNQNPNFDIFPSPSPDGSKLAYVADLSSTSDLRVLTVSTGAVTDLHLVAWAPVWAPTGQTIAYINQLNYSGQIALVNADGTGQRLLSTATYQQNFDWSPDGLYIIAQNANTGQFDLIIVASGATLPLPYTAGFYSPTWNPTSGSSAQRIPTAAPRARTNTMGRRR